MGTISALESQESRVVLFQAASRNMLSCVCASEISLKGTSRTLEPTSDKIMHGQFCSFIRCIGLFLELFFKGLFSRKGLQNRKAASFNKAKFFCWETEATTFNWILGKASVDGCLLRAARWAVCYQGTWLSNTNAPAQWVSQKALYMKHCTPRGCSPF